MNSHTFSVCIENTLWIKHQTLKIMESCVTNTAPAWCLALLKICQRLEPFSKHYKPHEGVEVSTR